MNATLLQQLLAAGVETTEAVKIASQDAQPQPAPKPTKRSSRRIAPARVAAPSTVAATPNTYASWTAAGSGVSKSGKSKLDYFETQTSNGRSWRCSVPSDLVSAIRDGRC